MWVLEWPRIDVILIPDVVGVGEGLMSETTHRLHHGFP